MSKQAIKEKQRLNTNERQSKTIFHVDSSVFGESFVSIPGIKEFAGMDVGFSNCWSVDIETASFTLPVTETTRTQQLCIVFSIKYAPVCKEPESPD